MIVCFFKFPMNCMLIDCWNILLGKLTPKNIMVNNGWAADDDTNINFDSCDRNIYFGYKAAESVGQLSTIFKGTGKANLVFDNCWSSGYLSVLINEDEIVRVHRYTEASIRFNYSKEDVFRIEAFNVSFSVNGCNGRLTNSSF